MYACVCVCECDVFICRRNNPIIIMLRIRFLEERLVYSFLYRVLSSGLELRFVELLSDRVVSHHPRQGLGLVTDGH